MFVSDVSVSFSAYLSSSLSNHHSQIIVYNEVETNEGSAYDQETGIFTAPANATYFFTWHGMTFGQTYYCHMFLYKNDARMNFAAMADMSGRSGGGNDSGSNSAVLSLTMGDRLWIQTVTCFHLHPKPYTSFSGFKI